jgi:anti-sigma-K factor RskA
MAREKDIIDRPDASMEAAEYVLGVMSVAERQTFTRRLASDESLRVEVVYWENRLSPMAEDVVPTAPPATVFKSIEQRLFAEDAKPGLLQSLGFWRGLSFASLAAAVLLGGLLFKTLEPGPDGSSTLIAELAGESKTVRLAVAYDTAAGVLNINRVEGAAATGRDFELWLIAGSNAPVSLGVLPQNAQGSIVVPEALRATLANAILAISDEPDGGSTTGAPTGAVLATGQVLTVS